MIGSHDILDSGRFGFVCLSSLVAIHDGDGHDEEANVGLGRKSRREGGRKGGREEGREGGLKMSYSILEQSSPPGLPVR